MSAFGVPFIRGEMTAHWSVTLNNAPDYPTNGRTNWDYPIRGLI